MRLTSANQAIIPLSMRSVFSRKPIASAKRRTARGLTIAVARSALHSMAKASRSYPPVASSATKPTWCSLQNAINSVIPALSLVKRRIAPSRPSRTSSAAEQTSTPQIRSVTVTCLVHAIDNRATVRSCVTLQQAVPRLTSGCCRRGNGRRAPRTGSGGHLTPCSAVPITFRRRLLDTRDKPQALIILADRIFLHNRARLMDFATQNRLPGVYAYRELVEAGGLMSYGPSYEDLHRRAATYVDKILKGAKPADLPIEQATKFNLVINRRAAAALGLTIPRSILARADEVIE